MREPDQSYTYLWIDLRANHHLVESSIASHNPSRYSDVVVNV